MWLLTVLTAIHVLAVVLSLHYLGYVYPGTVLTTHDASAIQHRYIGRWFGSTTIHTSADVRIGGIRSNTTLHILRMRVVSVLDYLLTSSHPEDEIDGRCLCSTVLDSVELVATTMYTTYT